MSNSTHCTNVYCKELRIAQQINRQITEFAISTSFWSFDYELANMS
jgi:hypothetical protein